MATLSVASWGYYILLQVIPSSASLKRLIWTNDQSKALQIFLESACTAIKDELSTWSYHGSHLFPQFDSISSLASDCERLGTDGNVLLSTVLLLLNQLGALVVRAEHSDIFAKYWEPTYSVGLCTGLLSAAVSAVARSLSHFLELAPEIVRISLRLAREAACRSHQIENSTKSWAAHTSKLSPSEVQSILDRLQEAQPHRKAYISAQTSNSVTISGPPSVLEKIFSNSRQLSEGFRAWLPISAAFHASHLQHSNIDEIVGEADLLNAAVKENSGVFSTTSGDLFQFDTLRSLVYQIVEEVLCKPVLWSKTLENIASKLSGQDVVLITAGPLTIAQSFRNALSASGAHIEEVSTTCKAQAEDLEDDIAIIGMSGRFPGGDCLEQFWYSLAAGHDLHIKIPKDRFDLAHHGDVSGKIKNTTSSSYGCFLDRPGHFDARFFNMSPREAKQTDPTQRLLMLTTTEALDMAGYNDGIAHQQRIGTFFGQTTDDWRETNASQDIDLYYVPGVIRAFGPGRLNFHFKWEGPSYSMDAACSSSAVAIEMACRAIKVGDCDMAVAGGGNILTGPQMFSGLSRGSFLSTTGSCKTFDQSADGYCRGEGVGVVILRRLKDAIADRQNILGVIRSVATNHSAYATSITHPHTATQEKLYQRVLCDAHLEPKDIDYVEAHGTGTQAGDESELSSIGTVFGSSRNTGQPLYVGAVKANVGHGEAAAGITSLIKSLLMFKMNSIPPHAGIKTTPNPKVSTLSGQGIEITQRLLNFEPKSPGDGKRRILINNFNATGGNTSIVVEDYPSLNQDTSSGSTRSLPHLITLSAKSKSSLRANQQHLLEYLKNYDDKSFQMADLAYTLSARRMHYNVRTAYLTTNLSNLKELLAKDIEAKAESSPNHNNSRLAVAFSFPGQGSKLLGVGCDLFRTCAAFRKTLLQLDNVSQSHGLPSFLKLLTTQSSEINGVQTAVQMQLALVSLEIALAELWKSWGLNPTVVIGHSLGEYAALNIAGVLSISDTLYLVGRRAELLESDLKSHSHAMLAIQQPLADTERLLEVNEYSESCTVACINGPFSTVVSGLKEDLELLKGIVAKNGNKSVVLETPFAFHSAQMDPILDNFEAIARHVQFQKPKIPIVSTLLASVVTADDDVFGPAYLRRQTRESVNFMGALLAAQKHGLANDHTFWIEPGPGSVTSGFIRTVLGQNSAGGISHKESAQITIGRTIVDGYKVGASIDWSEFYRYEKSRLHLLELPAYSFDLKNYWLPYVGNWALMRDKDEASAPNPSKFSTVCLQKVESETFDEHRSQVSFSSDCSEPRLLSMISGHLVCDANLCPSSVYSDMAFTAANFLWEKNKRAVHNKSLSMDLRNLQLHNPLIVDSGGGLKQNVITTCKMQNNDDFTTIEFSSHRNNVTEKHGHCEVHFGDGSQWKISWSKISFLVLSRMRVLQSSSDTKQTLRIPGPIVYKLFSSLVAYHESYHGLDEVILDSSQNEAVASIKLRPSEHSDEVTYDPYWIDSIVHLAGFVLNGNINRPHDSVYISHGWESLRIVGRLSAETVYQSYVRMEPLNDRGLFVGDVYLFHGDEVIAVCSGLKFQRIKYALLQSLLHKKDKTSHSTRQPKAADVGHQAHTNPAIDSNFHHTVKPHQTSAALKDGRRNAQTSAGSHFETFKSILMEEVGVDASDLSEDSSFDALGVDSLLTISLIRRLEEATQTHFSANIFMEYSTLRQFKEFLDGRAKHTSNNESALQPRHQSNHIIDSPKTLSFTESNSSSSNLIQTPQVSSQSSSSSLIDVFVREIAAESGVKESDIDNVVTLPELGVDSLLSITVLDNIRKHTGLYFPANFLTDNPTISAIRKALQATDNEPSSTSDVLQGTEGPSALTHQSSTVLLQGNSEMSPPYLFLFPAGSGGIENYIHMPSFSHPFVVYGLESPFLNDADAYKGSIPEVASLFVQKIKQIQNQGPYVLGGWSVGGMLAYEAARQLLNSGDVVSGLILIESPRPRPVWDLPEPTVELIDMLGIILPSNRRNAVTARMRKQHMANGIALIHRWEAEPMDPARQPLKTAIIWAKQGCYDRVSQLLKGAAAALETGSATAIDTTILHSDTKPSYGPSGWEELVRQFECHTVDGDHESMWISPQVQATTQLLERVMCTMSGISM